MRLVRYAALFAAVTLAATTAKPQSGVGMVTGVPFSATVISTDGDPAHTSIVKFARASNGSTYAELPARPGLLGMVIINDVPNRRTISINPNTRTYSVQPANLPPLKQGEVDDAQVRERIARYNTITAQHFAANGREGDTTPLGFRTVNGLVEYGTKTTYTKLPETSHLRQKVWEQWDVPALYLTAETSGFDDAGNAVQSTRYTDIKATEPDVHLFEIPQDYTLATGQRRIN